MTQLSFRLWFQGLAVTLVLHGSEALKVTWEESQASLPGGPGATWEESHASLLKEKWGGCYFGFGDCDKDWQINGTCSATLSKKQQAAFIWDDPTKDVLFEQPKHKKDDSRQLVSCDVLTHGQCGDPCGPDTRFGHAPGTLWFNDNFESGYPNMDILGNNICYKDIHDWHGGRFKDGTVPGFQCPHFSSNFTHYYGEYTHDEVEEDFPPGAFFISGPAMYGFNSYFDSKSPREQGKKKCMAAFFDGYGKWNKLKFHFHTGELAADWDMKFLVSMFNFDAFSSCSMTPNMYLGNIVPPLCSSWGALASKATVSPATDNSWVNNMPWQMDGAKGVMALTDAAELVFLDYDTLDSTIVNYFWYDSKLALGNKQYSRFPMLNPCVKDGAKVHDKACVGEINAPTWLTSTGGSAHPRKWISEKYKYVLMMVGVDEPMSFSHGMTLVPPNFDYYTLDTRAPGNQGGPVGDLYCRVHSSNLEGLGFYMHSWPMTIDAVWPIFNMQTDIAYSKMMDPNFAVFNYFKANFQGIWRVHAMKTNKYCDILRHPHFHPDAPSANPIKGTRTAFYHSHVAASYRDSRHKGTVYHLLSFGDTPIYSAVGDALSTQPVFSVEVMANATIRAQAPPVGGGTSIALIEVADDSAGTIASKPHDAIKGQDARTATGETVTVRKLLSQTSIKTVWSKVAPGTWAKTTSKVTGCFEFNHINPFWNGHFFCYFSLLGWYYDGYYDNGVKANGQFTDGAVMFVDKCNGGLDTSVPTTKGWPDMTDLGKGIDETDSTSLLPAIKLWHDTMHRWGFFKQLHTGAEPNWIPKNALLEDHKLTMTDMPNPASKFWGTHAAKEKESQAYIIFTSINRCPSHSDWGDAGHMGIDPSYFRSKNPPHNWCPRNEVVGEIQIRDAENSFAPVVSITMPDTFTLFLHGQYYPDEYWESTLIPPAMIG